METTAVLILKSFHEVKPELARVLNVGETRALVKAMFEDVLTATLECAALGEAVVLSPEAEVLEHARDRGAATRETEARGIDAAFREGAGYAMEQGRDLLVCLPSDLPLLTPHDLDTLLGRMDSAPKAAVVPSTVGPGTSILATRPPDVLEPRFEADDHRVHVEEGERRAIPVEVVQLLHAGLDVDTPKDLARLFLVEASCATRDLLEDMEILDRLRPFF